MISKHLKQILVDRAIGKAIVLDPLLQEVLDLYMTDVNSSSLREYITTWICGYEPIFGKLGRDAYDPTNNKSKEIKPYGTIELITLDRVSEIIGQYVFHDDLKRVFTIEGEKIEAKTLVEILNI